MQQLQLGVVQLYEHHCHPMLRQGLHQVKCKFFHILEVSNRDQIVSLDPGGKKWPTNKKIYHFVLSGLDLLNEGLLGFLLELESSKWGKEKIHDVFLFEKDYINVSHFCSK
jgi:hypothetical protein